MGFDLGQIGQALQGYSAGSRGQLPQLLEQQARSRQMGIQEQRQAQQQQSQQQDEERMQSQAFLGVAHTGYGLAQQGQFGQVSSLLQNTLQMPRLSSKLVQEAQNMLSLSRQAEQGNPEAAQALTGFLSQGAEVAVNSGVVNLDKKNGMASAKTDIKENGTVIQSLPNGDVEVKDPSGNLVTGAARLEAIRNSRDYKLSGIQAEADIAIQKAEKMANASHRASRVGAVSKELSDRNRSAARSAIRINQALHVAASATQGAAGAGLLKLAKLLPGIDVGNEALLDQGLKQLAVDQLQQFTGPTTDFEFGIVESSTGAIGDAKTANIARLNSLKRAGWFNQQEFNQFQRHTKSGGDPDAFRFNFGESITTKKGVFTLQDLQDTAVDNNLSIDEILKRLNQ